MYIYIYMLYITVCLYTCSSLIAVTAFMRRLHFARIAPLCDCEIVVASEVNDIRCYLCLMCNKSMHSNKDELKPIPHGLLYISLEF